MSVAVLMVLLCGCRTRITNNTEVAGVVNDESGMLQETYQVRRDELGIPIAKPPLFTGFESDEEDYEDEDSGYFDEYSEKDYDEEEDIDEDEDLEENNDPEENNNSGYRVANRKTPPVRRPVNRNVRRSSTKQTTGVKVTLDVNGTDATCSKSSVTVKKGSSYGALPTPVRDGYAFDGWFTDPSDGSKVDSDTKMTADKAHTLYAHWTKAETKTYTITFDGNGGEDAVELSSTEMKVEEDGAYGDMPSAKRKKYNFSGWFTDPADGSQITAGTKFTVNDNQTLYAHWEFDPYTWWDNEVTASANAVSEESEPDCIIDGGDDTENALIKECRGHIVESSPVYVFTFMKNYDEEKAAQEAASVYDKYSESAPDVKVVVVNDGAIKGSKEEKLLYKMMLLEILHGNGGDIDEAASDMLEGDASVSYPYVYPTE